MRPIARQSARLAPHTRVPHASLRRTPLLEQQRTLNTTLPRSQEPRPPSSSSDPHASFNERREHTKKTDHGEPRQEKGVEEEGTESAAANDGRKHAFRRTMRQKRANDVPKPPPIPDWFLRHNVQLYKHSPGIRLSEDAGQVIRCVDAETGHTLFTVPYYEAQPEKRLRKAGKEELPRKEEARSPVTSKVDGPAKEASPQVGAEDATTAKEQPTQKAQPVSIKASTLDASIEPSHTERPTGSSFDRFFFDPKLPSLQEIMPKKEPISTREPASKNETPPKKSSRFTSFVSKESSPLRSNDDPMRWAFLEAEAGVRAALSLADDNQRSSSFAADRVDLSLQCPEPKSHDEMDQFVRDLSRIVQADLIRLDVNDFAELAEHYVGHGHDEPGSFSSLGYDVFDGYEASGRAPSRVEEPDEDEMDEDEESEEDESDAYRGNGVGRQLGGLEGIRRAMQDRLGNALSGRVIGIGIGIPSYNRSTSMQQPTSRSRGSSNSDTNRDDARIAALLEQLLDAPKQKRVLAEPSDFEEKPRRRYEMKKSVTSKDLPADQDKSWQQLLNYWRSEPAHWLPMTAKSLVGYLGGVVRGAHPAEPPITLASEPRAHSGETSTQDGRSRTIVHVRDLRDLCSSRLGDNIIHHLVRIVRKRRRGGQQVIVVGSTAQDVPGPFRMPGEPMDEFPFRALSIPPFFHFSHTDKNLYALSATQPPAKSLDDPAYRRIMEINLRHIQSMLRRLRPDDSIHLLAPEVHGQLNLPGMHFLTEKVLSLDSVQRLAMTAIGLSKSHARADVVHPIHVALAGLIMVKSDHAAASWAAFKESKQMSKLKKDLGSSFAKGDTEAEGAGARMDRLKRICSQHETRLLTGMVDPRNIKTGFADVHAPAETIEALKSLTTLSLLRPEAFKYGVLANDRLPGLLLYGPPGTGKTLLAKAVAKESSATVLEVSGAQIYEKYVGEGEKMVRAVFSLAKKLSPCVVFIDEADAIFGSRSNMGNRNTHREIINQFLREWDGMDDHSVFMMVATNRPFDLDDAVLRRLPRRLLIDLPVAKDRESILGIHLKDEALDPSVSLSTLAEQTPLYSGSDLKNLAVAAALACVREENALLESHKEDKDFKLPEKRTLTPRHFEKAQAEISASISEDMKSLNAIRKFDEQYGDRKGRRKKTGYGFGAADGSVDEGAARVRQPTSAPPSPP